MHPADHDSIRRDLDQACAAGDHDEADRIMAEVDGADTARNARLTAPDALGNAALWYAGQGLPVFPLRPGEKSPLTAHGFKDATTDVEQVKAWWSRTPQANIGLPTGGGFDVLDVDDPEGYSSLAQLRAVPTVLAVALTPRGKHLYLPATGRGNGAGMAPGLDFRGRGGYVLAPPSRVGGRAYSWVGDTLDALVAAVA